MIQQQDGEAVSGEPQQTPGRQSLHEFKVPPQASQRDVLTPLPQKNINHLPTDTTKNKNTTKTAQKIDKTCFYAAPLSYIATCPRQITPPYITYKHNTDATNTPK